MDLFEAIKKRHCCRSFDPTKKVTTEDVGKIIEAGKMAPSAGKVYPLEFIVIDDNEEIVKLTRAARNSDYYYIEDAPVNIAIVANVDKTEAKFGTRGRELYVAQDSAAAAENMFLAATALGLNTSWVGAFDEEKVSKFLKLESSQRPLVIMPIGFAK